jgi:hemerythrin
MLPLVWSDEYRVGVDKIDVQHRRLIEMLAKFYASLAEGRAESGLGELLKGLLDYTVYHFSTEETLMQQWQYPSFEAHQAMHAAFVAKVTDMAERFTNGKLVLSLEATRYVRSWLTEHILGTDRQLGQFLASRGVH